MWRLLRRALVVLALLVSSVMFLVVSTPQGQAAASALLFIPQVLPVIIGTIIYRWDINIRESTVLGLVGAGGIGIQLYASINQFAWQEVSLMLIAVFCVVVVSEFVSATVRRRIT